MPTAVRTIANDSLFCDSRRVMAEIEDELVVQEAMTCPIADVERLVEQRVRELARKLLQANLDLRAAKEREVEVTGADGVARRQVRTSTRKLETIVGEVTVARRIYQAPGWGVDSLAPMDAVLNLPAERYSHHVRRVVAEQASRSSFEEVVEFLAKHTGADVPKRQVEELSQRAAQDFDGFYAARAIIAENTDDLLVLSFDGKGIAMRHEDLREATQKAAAATPRRLATRLTSGEKPNRKRMATVATIYSIAPWRRTVADVVQTLRAADVEADRPRPSNKRVWASLEHSAAKVYDDAFAEARRRDPARRRRWVVLLDGQRDQLRGVQRAARRAGVTVTIVVDIVHVLEYLWRAAHAFHAAGTEEAETWVRHRLLALLDGRTGGTVAKSIRLMAARRELDAAGQRAIDKCTGYLAKLSRYMHYGAALAAGLPIATGVIEGACRYLVQDRLGRTGARWSLDGAEAVLRLRALRASGDFDAYWTFHTAKERERNHLSRYADATAPDPMPPTRPALAIVK